MNQKLAGVNKDYGINQKLNVHKHVFNFYSLELRRKSNSLKKKIKKKSYVLTIKTLMKKISYILNKISSLFAPPARRKSKEQTEMPKVWPVHDEV